jgi:nicotinamidase-related amidase
MNPPLDPGRTVVVVIDVQEKLLPAIAHRDAVLRGVRLLLRVARVLDLPTVLTTQYAQGLGPTVAEVLDEAPGCSPIDKTSFGAFGAEAFRGQVSALGRSHLLVAGIEAHICVAQTVLGALDAGYAVHVANDAVASRTEANREIGLHRMDRAGAVISSVEMAVYELVGRSDTPAFKALLPHLKG